MPRLRSMEERGGLGGMREGGQDRNRPIFFPLPLPAPPQFPETLPSPTFLSSVNQPVRPSTGSPHFPLVIEPQISAFYLASQATFPRLRKLSPHPIPSALSWAQPVHQAGDGEGREIDGSTDGGACYEWLGCPSPHQSHP